MVEQQIAHIHIIYICYMQINKYKYSTVEDISIKRMLNHKIFITSVMNDKAITLLPESDQKKKKK